MAENFGIVAGSGNFPCTCARAAKRGNDARVIALAIRGFADSQIEKYVDEVFWIDVGQIGKLIKLCKNNDIKQVTFAGKVEHVSLLHLQRFDMRAIKILSRLPDKRAETVLRAVMDELASEDIKVVDSTLFLKDSLAKPGLLTLNRPLSKSEDKDVRFAYPLAKEISQLDIGQTIVVKNQIIVAVEGIEGTDRCIQRAAEYVGEGIIVVKVSRPTQDFRFDLPVIGLDTVRRLKEAKASCIAISAEECLFFDQEEAIKLAEETNIAITAI